jgi:sugar phosphate isomerase/epimerase
MKLAITIANQTSSRSPVVLSGDIAAIPKVRALGYDGCELHSDSADVLDVNAISKACRENKISVSALATGRGYTKYGLSLIDDDESLRKQAVRFVKKYVVVAEALRSCVIIGCIRGNLPAVALDSKDNQYYERLAFAMSEIVSFAHDHDVPIVLEAINRFENNYLNSVHDVRDFIDNYALKGVKILLDTFHMNIEDGDIYETVAASRESLGYVHIADSNRWPPGFGHFDFESFFKALYDIGYKGWVSAECLPLPDEEQAAKQWIKYVKDMEERNE